MTNKLACVWTMAAAIGVIACDAEPNADQGDANAAIEARSHKPPRRSSTRSAP